MAKIKAGITLRKDWQLSYTETDMALLLDLK
jgi:hypothetical protein